MFKDILFVSSVVAVLCCVGAESLSITKCKVNDQECHKKSAQNFLHTFVKGIPEYGIESLDPLKLKQVDGTTADLKLRLSDLIVKGLKNCVVKKIDHNTSLKKMFLKFMCNSVVVDGKYVMNGKLLVLPINGDGDINVHLRKVLINVEANLSEIEAKDGKNHWKVGAWENDFELKDKADLSFTKLFNGNELLASVAHNLIKESGNIIVEEFGAPVVKAIANKIVDRCQKLFMHVPVEELALP